MNLRQCGVYYFSFECAIWKWTSHHYGVTLMQESCFGSTSLVTTSGAIRLLQAIGCANASAIGTKKGECFELTFLSLQLVANVGQLLCQSLLKLQNFLYACGLHF